MPEDSPPLSTTVTETVTTDLGVSKENQADLNKSFQDFWAETDKAPAEGGTAAPEAPAAPVSAPQKEAATPATTTTEPPPEPPKEGAATPPPEPVDIDKLELTAGAYTPRPEHQEQFKRVKELWKIDQRRAEEAARKAQTLENELAEARKNAWTPETKADYEQAVEIRRRFDFMSDPEFQQKFHAPVRTQFERILDEAVQVLPDRQAAQQWAQHIKQNYGPDAVNRDWWLNSVVAKVPNELDRTTLLNSVSKLLDLQKDRDGEITRRTNDKSSFDNWIQEKTNITAGRVHQEIMDEIGKQEPRIKEVLPVDVSQAKTVDERAAMEAHNERFKNLNNFFLSQVQDLSKHGPRAWVRVAVEATRSMIMNDQIVNLEKELKDTKGERDRYKTELEKITGARRKLAQTTGIQPSAAETKKNGQGLSVKDLSDPRKAMSSYWDDIDRNQ
jgi:hypothetical protein